MFQYIKLLILELEDSYVIGFDFKSFPKDYKDKKLHVDKVQESIITEELNSIFSIIKTEQINSKLLNIDDENLYYVQDLIFIKQNL